jgi:hypothetical protein
LKGVKRRALLMVTENDDDDGVMGRDTLEEQRRLRLLEW